MDTKKIEFSGSDYDIDKDKKRLTGQLLRIFDCIKDGKARTLREIEDITGDPQASISAQLRNLRKYSFGAHTITRSRRDLGKKGIFEYKLENK